MYGNPPTSLYRTEAGMGREELDKSRPVFSLRIKRTYLTAGCCWEYTMATRMNLSGSDAGSPQIPLAFIIIP